MIEIRDFLYMDETGTYLPIDKTAWMYQGRNTETNMSVTILVDSKTKPNEEFDKKIRDIITKKLSYPIQSNIKGE